MPGRTTLWQGQNKFAMIRILLLIAGYTLAIITFMVLGQFTPGTPGTEEAPTTETKEEGEPLVPLAVILGLVFTWIIYGIIFAVVGFVYPLLIEKRKQEEANEIECCCEGSVKLGKSPAEYMLLPFVYLEELKIKWDDDNIKAFVNSKEGQRVKQILERKVALEDYLSLKKTIEKTEKRIQEKKQEQEGSNDNEVSQEPKYKFEYDKSFEELYQELQGGLIEIDKKKIEGLYFYIGLLNEQLYFEGFETVPFERAVQITREPREKVLKTYSRKVLDYENYEVNVHHVYTHHICYGLLSNGIPIFYLHSSENMADEQTNLVLNAQELNYIEVHILRYLLNEAQFFNESGEKALIAAEAKKELYRQKWEVSIQEWEDSQISLGTGIDEVDKRNLQIEIENLKKFKLLAGLLGVVVIILLIILFLVIGGNQTAPENTKELMLLFYYLPQLLLNSTKIRGG